MAGVQRAKAVATRRGKLVAAARKADREAYTVNGVYAAAPWYSMYLDSDYEAICERAKDLAEKVTEW